MTKHSSSFQFSNDRVFAPIDHRTSGLFLAPMLEKFRKRMEEACNFRLKNFRRNKKKPDETQAEQSSLLDSLLELRSED